MKVIKKKIDTEKTQELEKLLYRKHSCETLMPIWSKGITIYTSYIDMMKIKINDDKVSEEEKLKAQLEIYDNESKLKNFITQFKLTQREFKHFILPKIEELATKEDKENIDFDSINEIVKQTAKNEIYNSYEIQPENIELIEVNTLLNSHIKILEQYGEQLKLKLDNEKDLYKISKMQKELFDINLNLINNKKRLGDRLDYYENQFYPQFIKDMKEAEIFLPKYLKKASQIVELNIDKKLHFLLDEYEKHKEDEEKLWLFYTALKQRVESILKELADNTLLGKTKDKKIIKLLQPII
jgi:hypothetical protein